jgi:hypothetical protein
MENQLAVIVKESGLEETKGAVLTTKFSTFFDEAAKWAEKAKAIVITDASQTADMQIARIGRLNLRDMRLAIKKTHDELKKASLDEGRAIDRIANALTAAITPTEEYLDLQEHFVENKAKAEAERARIIAEEEARQKQLARERAELEENERLAKENAKLKAEAEAREKEMEEERIYQEKLLRQEHEEAERKAKEEKEKADAILKAEQDKAEAARKAVEEKARKEREEAEKKNAEDKAKADAEKAKVEAEKKALEARLAAMVECPNCHHKFVPGD